ncbi:MAG: UbiA family prenyltransferase [bacterium]|nr:UbiA family prenyltransferase [bacterium]
MALLRFLLYSEVSVLACALALGWTGLQISGQPVDLNLLALIGSATFLFYTLERNLTLPVPSRSIFPEKSRWLQRNRQTNALLLLVSMSVTLTLMPHLSGPGLVSLGVFGFLALCYSIIKFPRKGLAPQGLKRSYLLKPLLMVLVWTYMTLVLPLVETGLPQQPERAWWLLLVWVLWIFSNSILFDIRDLQVDKQSGVRTLAALLGRPRAHGLIYLLGLTQLLVCAGFAWRFQEPLAAAAMTLSTLAFMACNAFLHQRGPSGLKFYILADLTLILPALALGGTHWILTR